VWWIASEPVAFDNGPGEPPASVVVMIARAVDNAGHDISDQVAAVVREALIAMSGESA